MNVDGWEPGELAMELERRAGICTRPGIHCAPLAHRTIGTHPRGTCRLSFGPLTTGDDIAVATAALIDLSR